MELKFIRGCGKCGHIEDVVVDSTYRGLRLGLRVIEALMAAAQARRITGFLTWRHRWQTAQDCDCQHLMSGWAAGDAHSPC